VLFRSEGGEHVRINVQGSSDFDGRLGALAARIHQAKAARAAFADSKPLDSLARGSDPIPEWRRRVLSLLERPSSYRQASITPEDLAHVARNPEAPAEQRIAAALAIGRTNDPTLRKEVRIAADACVHPRLRIALRQALKETPEETAILEALAESESRQLP